jgi:histidyl-tRNA synthetase
LEFTTIRGFKDVLPDEVGYWQKIESEARRLFGLFGYFEIRLPLLERTELFSRGIGQDTDIVSKEMYTLQDSKGRGLTLRPEATASVCRAFIQHRLYQKTAVQKLFTIGPMFRHERPQKGRFRQFHQIDAEILGDPGFRSDADLIVLAMTLVESFGLRELSLCLNSLGCPNCRPRFKDKLKAYLAQKKGSLCTDCEKRAEANPLRVFDCKVEGCKSVVSNAPSILKFLCGECRHHFEALQGSLSDTGIAFVIDYRLVRGLDYYSRTTFEIQTARLGAQNAVVGGGRYDGLVRLLGGPDQPAIGFALGMERVIALLEEASPPPVGKPDLFVAALGEAAQKACFVWTLELRKAGFSVEADYGSKGLKAQMKRADRLGSKWVLIVGDEELALGKGILRDMQSKEQANVDLGNLKQSLQRFAVRGQTK